MASPRQLINVGIAATTLLGAWRTFRRADSRFGQLRALIGIVTAVGVVYGIVTNSSRNTLT